MNSYELSRMFFDWCFINPEKITPNHCALYFFAIEHCNRLGWKKKFGLPTTMTKEAIGIKSYNTYKKTLTDLVNWGFIQMIEKSKNQYSSNIIALSKFDKALDKALDKAMTKHLTKQSESTRQSNSSINKHNNIEHNNNKQEGKYFEDDFLNSVFKDYLKMRKEIKKPASEKAIELCIKKLEKLSNGNTEIKTKILEQSILNSWQGIFELKESERKNLNIRNQRHIQHDTDF